MAETHFYPTEKAQGVTLAELQQRFVSVGLPCRIELASPETCWVVFATHESSIFASMNDSGITLATFIPADSDDHKVRMAVEGVMSNLGFSADEAAAAE